MSKGNQSARKKGTELLKEESDYLKQRGSICQMKSNDIERARIELLMLNESYMSYMKGLILKYELDQSKTYTFNGNEIIEVEQPEVDK